MTKKEFEEKIAGINQKIRDLENTKSLVEREYADSIGGPYKHLIGKWVTVTYLSSGGYELTMTGFWKGVSLALGSLLQAEVYKAKKDGTPSTRTEYTFIRELISVVETER